MIKEYLKAPAWWCTEQCGRVLSPHLPQEQFESFKIEILYRTALTVVTVSVSPIAAIALIGVFLVAATPWDDPPPYRLLITPSNYKNNSTSFSLLNANICGMSGILATVFGGVHPIRHRIDKIHQLTLNKNPDFITFQEASDPLAMENLATKLHTAYPEVIYRIGESSDPTKLGSGLLIASKIRIESFSFHPFEAALGFQHYVNKGFVICDLANKVRVIATHLQPGDDEEASDVRTRQLNQLLPYVNENSILVGDLNEERSNSKISSLLHDPFAGTCPETCTDALTDYRKGKTDLTNSKKESIDYIATSKTSNLTLDQQRIVPLYDIGNPSQAISDHQGLWAEFSFRVDLFNQI